jgi:hypothetical protein
VNASCGVPARGKLTTLPAVTRSIARFVPFALFAALALAGCAKRHHIAIQSNTCWIATIDQQRDGVINDCGSTTFRVAGEIHCVAITNLSDTGFVRVRIDDGVWAESAAPRGTAETCR